ncbi:MAG: ferritin [Candidatus Methylacidiphilales bacterium]|nr:ferritin [Candidatus Methylacidiphilales bacterium]
MHLLTQPEIVDAINAQIGREFSASHNYVVIAAYFGAENLPELSAHFYAQAEEEKDHAMKFVHYVVEIGGKVAIPPIASYQAEFASSEAAVQVSLDAELTVTSEINKLMDLSIKHNDHTTANFLRWFVSEQLEEVSSMEELLRMVQRAGEDGLLRVEEYLARKNGPRGNKASYGNSAD